MASTQGLPAEVNGWHQLVYAPILKRSVMLALYHQRNSEPNESMVAYNFKTNSWEVIDMGGNFHTETMPEGGESQGYFDFNPNNNTIVYHCCTTGSNQPENANHTWLYDLVGQSGRDRQTSPKPPASVLQPGGAFDAAHNIFIMHGGDSYNGTWTYDPTGNAWLKKNTLGTAPDPSIILPTIVYSSAAQKVYLFGGQVGLSYTNDLYSYDYPTNTWTLLSPAGGVKPPGRYRHAMAYDSTNNVFLMYGGQNGAGILNDTWIYNPSTNAWTGVNPPQSPPISTTAIFAKLAYDSDNNVFVLAQTGTGGYFGGDWTAYSVQTWLFRYKGTGPNAGTVASTAAPAPGGLNRNTVSWAKDPVVASSGGSLYVAWSETGSPYDLTDGAWPHIYVSQYSAGAWVPLGDAFTSVSSTPIREAHAPSLTLIGGVPWASWYESDNAGGTAKVFAKNWDGLAWQGGRVGLIGATSHIYQGQSSMTAAGVTPHVALLEVDKDVFPQRTLAYVKTWNGTAWTLKGGALNLDQSPGSTALSVSIAADGSNVYAAWPEYLHLANNGDGYDYDINPQIHVSAWNGTQWAPLGGSLNTDLSSWAFDPSIAVLNGQIYVAWTERSKTGNAQLYVKKWDGTSWTPASAGSLNRGGAAGWSYHPSLIPDSAANVLYLGWVEQPALGQKAQVYIGRYSGGVWTAVGGALNADSLQGSGQRVSIGVYNGQPIAAWGEVNLGALRQVYVKQWNGASWTLLGGTGGLPDTTAPTAPLNPSAIAKSGSSIMLTWDLATDTTGVTGYLIYRGGVQIADVTSARSITDVGLAAGTSYSYRVAAYDAAHNISPLSSTVAAITFSSDTTPPVVGVTSPANGIAVAGGVTISASATDNVGVSMVQFKLDGANLGGPITGSGPTYSFFWNTTTAADGSHVLSAAATDAAGNSASSSVTIKVSNAIPPAAITAVSASSITTSAATINWTTNTPADTQVVYGTSTAYGSTTALNTTLAPAHTVSLSGLPAATTYHYQVRSRDAQGSLSISGDFTFTTGGTSSGGPALFQLHADASEVSGVINGSTVTPASAPSGLTGKVVVNGAGTVNFTPGQAGNGVYFLNCCGNTGSSYYKFAGAGVGGLFDVNQGQITFYLKSRYSFAQRKASAAAPRYSFDARDGTGHLFTFLTQVVSGYLEFEYTMGNSTQYYFVPTGTEEALFGSGINLKVSLIWSGTTTKLYFNDVLVKSAAYSKRAANWTSTSNFNIGAFEYLTYGGYNASDDVIDEFTIIGTGSSVDTAPPVIGMTSPASGATVSGNVAVAANGTDNVGLSAVQFKLDGVNLGAVVTGSGPAYSVSWNSSTTTNGSHVLSATATDAAGNSASSSLTVTVSNVIPPPVISAVISSAVTYATATIAWTTDKAADSQVVYGTTIPYSLSSTLDPAMVTSHSVNLTGLAPSTTYHYQVKSRDVQGNPVSSGDSTFQTAAAPSSGSPLFQLHADATEVSGAINGSTVTPSLAPPGFTGKVVVNGSGSVNFTPAKTGNGVYFLNCCGNSGNSYYKFAGSGVGSLFDVNQGQVTFYLKSRYTFAQRKASAAAPRYSFDVRDGNGHLFTFMTQIVSGYLEFEYTMGGSTQYYFVPAGTEDALFGAGVNLKVAIVWSGTTAKLYLNDVPVRSTAYTKPAANWTSASNFNIGAYEYLTYGGYNGSDDIIDEFTILPQ